LQLCLGPGESGKSTVVKQLKNLHNFKMSDSERKAFISVLHENTLQCMQSLIKASAKMGFPITGELQKSAESVQSILGETPEESKLTPELANHISLLWKHESIQKAYARRSEFWVLDNADYYFSRSGVGCSPFDSCLMIRVKEFARSDYQPSEEDLILARARTVSRSELNLTETCCLRADRNQLD
jgi:hypothetical protein